MKTLNRNQSGLFRRALYLSLFLTSISSIAMMKNPHSNPFPLQTSLNSDTETIISNSEIERLLAIRRITTKESLAEEEIHKLLEYWDNRGERPSRMLGVEPEPVIMNTSSFEENDLPPPMPSLQEMRYGKASWVKNVLARDSNLIAQGIEYQKGGIANLLDIMLSGFLHGYVAPMSKELDSSMSSLKHGPYWAVIDTAKVKQNEADPLTQMAESSNFFINKYHLAYIVPDEKYQPLLNALIRAQSMGIINDEEFNSLKSKVIPFEEYLSIPSENAPLEERHLKEYLQNKALR